jgi:GDP-L-fucose synthase
MYKENEILITGGNGMVGTEFKKIYPSATYISRQHFDLCNEQDIVKMFNSYKPKCLIHLAAKVNGILDNINNQAKFFDENVLMNTLVLKHSYLNSVERFIGVLSSCMYPDISKSYPMDLNEVHSGAPNVNNFSYGYAKRCLAVQIDSYNKQYNTKYNYVIPCNLYGEHDKFDINKSHFISTLILKIKQAVREKQNHIVLFGDGTPLRQFMYANDLVNVIKFMIQHNIYENLNVAGNENLSIQEMAEIALNATNNQHLKIIYAPNTPNGQHRKDISTKRLKELMPDYNFVNLYEGIQKVYNLIKD